MPVSDYKSVHDAESLPRLNRFEVTSRLVAKLQKGEAVVGGIGNTNFDLWATGQRPENFYMLGSMGLAIPIALGVALAQPQRRVIALEGDGSLLMQVGALATVAHVRPKNLSIIVMDNGLYQITGSQPTTTASVADLVTMARGAGLRESRWAQTLEAFDTLIDDALRADEPSLIALPIDGESARATTERDPALLRSRFMRGLGVITS